MKILGRTLIILAAASVVVGVAYGISRTAWGDICLAARSLARGTKGQKVSPRLKGLRGGEFDPGALADMPERGDHHDFEGGRPGGGFSLIHTLGNLVVVGVISLFVIGVTWLFGRVKKCRRRRITPGVVT